MMTEGDLKEAARLIVAALREQITGKPGRRLKGGSVETLAIMGVANWIEKKFVGDGDPPTSP